MFPPSPMKRERFSIPIDMRWIAKILCNKFVEKKLIPGLSVQEPREYA